MLPPAPVRFFKDEWLPEPLRQRLTREAGDGVGCLACRKGDDDAHWPRRIGLRPSDARHGRERGSARGQMQKISAGKFHFEPPWRFTSFDHLVGTTEQQQRHGQAELLGRHLIDAQLHFRDLLRRLMSSMMSPPAAPSSSDWRERCQFSAGQGLPHPTERVFGAADKPRNWS